MLQYNSNAKTEDDSMQLTINIKNNSIAEKVLWFLEHLKNDGVDIEITENQTLEIESIDKNDPDYDYFLEAKEARLKGEKTYSINEVIKEFE